MSGINNFIKIDPILASKGILRKSLFTLKESQVIHGQYVCNMSFIAYTV